jgi:hypothetical protein
MFDYALSLVVKLYVGMFCIKLDYQSKGIIHAHPSLDRGRQKQQPSARTASSL